MDIIRKIISKITFKYKLYYKSHNINKQFYDLDRKGIRAFIKYSNTTGKWAIECYRKKSKSESEGSHDWRMIRVGSTITFFSRIDAELAVLKLAKELDKDII